MSMYAKHRGSSRAQRTGWLPIAIIALLPQLAASAAPAQVSLTFFPDTVRIGGVRNARTFLSLESRGAAVRDVRLEWLTPDSVQITVPDALPSGIGENEVVGGSAMVSGRVRSSGEKAFARVSYTAAGGVRKVVHAALHLAPRTPATIADLITVEIVTSLATLSDVDTGTVHLLVKNTSDYPVAIDSVQAIGPSFIAFDSGRGLEIPGRGTGLIRVDVKGQGWVRPGKHTLLFRTHARWTGPDGQAQGQLVQSREIDVGVAGQSEILQVLSVPSFLLLPGFLMVVAFGMLYNLLGHSVPVTEDPKKPQFWVLAVSLSFLTVFGYPLFGGRNFLHGYGMTDVAWVWFASVALGLFVAAAVDFTQKRTAEMRARQLADRIPADNDEVEIALRKLHRRQIRGIKLKRVDFQSDGQTRQGFLLVDRAEDGHAWVAPPAQYEWKDVADEAARDRLEQALKSGNLEEIADRLAEMKQAGQLRVYWRAQGGFRGPKPVAPEALKEVGVAIFVNEG